MIECDRTHERTNVLLITFCTMLRTSRPFFVWLWTYQRPFDHILHNATHQQAILCVIMNVPTSFWSHSAQCYVPAGNSMCHYERTKVLLITFCTLLRTSRQFFVSLWTYQSPFDHILHNATYQQAILCVIACSGSNVGSDVCKVPLLCIPGWVRGETLLKRVIRQVPFLCFVRYIST